MEREYFSDRDLGARRRIGEQVEKNAWGGIIVAVMSRIADGSFGYRYPLQCPDGRGVCGCDEELFSMSLQAEIPDIQWPLQTDQVPPTPAILDLVEFCYQVVAKPCEIDYHRFFGHSHFGFDREQGQVDFRNEINRIFSRNGLAYELKFDGRICRLAPTPLGEILPSVVFQTGDAELDRLLETARVKYLDPNPAIRRESLEKLWDAWERLKTVEIGKDKKTSTAELLNKAAREPLFREALEREATELTRIGNTFSIRHSEVSQVPLMLDDYVDYLFHRLFALIRLLLKTTGRGG
ncbi:MAG: hypothetical protein AB1700_03175 [Bacillota bacterium]